MSDYRKKRIYVLYDVVACETIGVPQIYANDLHATRMLRDVVNAPGNGVSEHPEDFVLLHLGFFNSETGVVEGLEVPISVVEAASLVTPSDEEVSSASAN